MLYSGHRFKYFASVNFTEGRENGSNEKPGGTLHLTDSDFD